MKNVDVTSADVASSVQCCVSQPFLWSGTLCSNFVCWRNPWA